jgi:hypothetical protein
MYYDVNLNRKMEEIPSKYSKESFKEARKQAQTEKRNEFAQKYQSILIVIQLI